MRFRDLSKFFVLPAYKPVEGISRLLNNKYKIAYAILIFFFLGILYTVSVQLAYSRGLGALVQPFINIPAQDYYFWQRFYQVPFFFLTSIVFAGTARLISIPFKGKGNFEDIFCILSISLTLPMLITMWVPETIYFIFFPGQGIKPVIVDILRQVAGIVWPLAICVIGITIIEKVRWYYSIIITLIASIPMAALMVIFIR